MPSSLYDSYTLIYSVISIISFSLYLQVLLLFSLTPYLHWPNSSSHSLQAPIHFPFSPSLSLFHILLKSSLSNLCLFSSSCLCLFRYCVHGEHSSSIHFIIFLSFVFNPLTQFYSCLWCNSCQFSIFLTSPCHLISFRPRAEQPRACVRPALSVRRYPGHQDSPSLPDGYLPRQRKQRSTDGQRWPSHAVGAQIPHWQGHCQSQVRFQEKEEKGGKKPCRCNAVLKQVNSLRYSDLPPF